MKNGESRLTGVDGRLGLRVVNDVSTEEAREKIRQSNGLFERIGGWRMPRRGIYTRGQKGQRTLEEAKGLSISTVEFESVPSNGESEKA